ncbi:MAG: hypothetical protein LLF86_03840 [Nitrospiraceae bacterium]|nr:hypothetical protein [Nitrospiraceae bacterium]
MIKRAFIIGNPAAGGTAINKINRAVSAARSKGVDAELLLTQGPLDAERFARQIAAEYSKDSSDSEPIVIAAGGDGTYNEVANGLVHSNIPMAILPMGTTSVLALELGISFDIDSAVSTALGSSTIKVSPARITLADGKSRYFLLMAGAGIDGKTVYGVNKTLKKISGKAAYIISGISALLSGHELFSATLTDENGNISTMDCGALIASKVSYYAGRFRATPDAEITSRDIHVFAGRSSRRIDVARYVFGIASGRHLGFRDITCTKTAKLKITGTPYIQIDGDYLGRGPAVIETADDELSIVVPHSYKK